MSGVDFCFGFVVKTAFCVLCQMLRLNGTFREMLDPLDQTNGVTHSEMCVCAVAELAQLPHPIKYACSVWAVFLFSGDVWALWIIRSKQDHEFWRTRVTPACTRAPRSGVIHQSQRCRCLKAPDETQPIYRPPRTHTDTPMLMHTSVHITRPLLRSLKLLVRVVTFSFSPNDSHSTPG